MTGLLDEGTEDPQNGSRADLRAADVSASAPPSEVHSGPPSGPSFGPDPKSALEHDLEEPEHLMERQSITPFGYALIGVGALVPLGLFFYGPSAIPLLLFLAAFINLLTLSLYDVRSFRLPNMLTFSFFCVAGVSVYVVPYYEWDVHVIGAVAGLLFPITLNAIYHRLRGRDGMGMGDAKLLAGCGLLLGWPALPLILSISSTLGIGYFLIGRVLKLLQKEQVYIPFGPFIAFATIALWVYFYRI